MSLWCERALIDGEFVPSVRVQFSPDGRIESIDSETSPQESDARVGTIVPGFGNAHSHLFHRALRGRTHDHGGDFWRWRDEMYAAAAALNPERYRALAVAVFSEMLDAGYTAVGEFHYVHHRPDGSPYDDHAMEIAVADAAEEVGIRLVLLDTCYLAGGIGVALSAAQQRFSDGTAERWLDRWHALREALGERPLVTLGAAIHSVRAVSADAIATVLAGLPADVPLHVHLSEQPQENADCLAHYRATPTGVLQSLGALTSRLTAVHATHLTDDDIAAIGEAEVSIALCPSTEADLGDGIGPARALADAGAQVAIGSDQNAVIDPLLELRGAEAGERLSRLRRGIFSPQELWLMGTANGYRSLGLGASRAAPGIAVGDWGDLVEVNAQSVRTVGSRDDQLVLTATAADVLTTIVGGRVSRRRDTAALLSEAIAHLDRQDPEE